jgi:ubiquinone/menaquinone biosynthesis C-methylase UbiE
VEKKKYLSFYNGSYLQHEITVKDAPILSRRLLSLAVQMRKQKIAKYCDVGCSQGYAFKVAKNFRCDIFGTDLSLILLKTAKNNAKRQGIPVMLVQADITALPFIDNAFDFVSSMQVIEHVPQFEKAIDEMLRISGKKIIISTDCLTKANGINFANLGDNKEGHLHIFNVNYLETFFKVRKLNVEKKNYHYPFIFDCFRLRFFSYLFNPFWRIYQVTLKKMYFENCKKIFDDCDSYYVEPKLAYLIEKFGYIYGKLFDLQVEILFSLSKKWKI